MRHLDLPPGMMLVHDGVRIQFVEMIDGFVLRFVIEGAEEEFLLDVGDGTKVRPTVRWLFEAFAAGELRDCTASEATLSEWRGRFLGLDREAVFAGDPRAVMKYEIALAAAIKRLPRSADKLKEFAKDFAARHRLPAPSGRSVIRWMDILVASDKRIGAMRNRSGREPGQSPLPPIVDRLVQQSMALFWSVESMKKMDSHGLVVATWRQLEARGVPNIGTAPPTKTTIVNRINRHEGLETSASKFGADEANRYYTASGEMTPVGKPFQLAYIDGTEYRQVCLFSEKARIPSNKMKTIEVMDAATLFVFPSTPFAGSYRSEMGMGAILGALAAPVLDEDTLAKEPMLSLIFGRYGVLRGDNDKAIIPPAAVGNLTSVIGRLELARKYGPDEKSNLENYFGWKKARLDGSPGTVLSPRSRRRSIRRDPLAEASWTRADLAREHERLRLEWNAFAHDALGKRSPNDIMLEHILGQGKIRFTPRGEILRHLARTVVGTLDTDGIVVEDIRYRWNRTGVTKLLSENQAAQAFSARLQGTASCEIEVRVYDWNLDFIDVLNIKATRYEDRFVTLWSDDPDYTGFLTRAEHRFHQGCVIMGATGAQTVEDKADLRGQNIQKAFADLKEGPYAIARKVAGVLEAAERREVARKGQAEPDLTGFEHLLLGTNVAGRFAAALPAGPPQTNAAKRSNDRGEAEAETEADAPTVQPAWGGLDPAPRSAQQLLGQDAEDDPDDGVEWDAPSRTGDGIDGSDNGQGKKNDQEQ